MHSPFDEDIANYSVHQLAHWINKCRTVLLSLNGEGALTADEWIVNAFCNDWFLHQDRNRELYNGYKYRRAINVLGMPQTQYIAIASDGNRVDLTPYLPPLMTNSFAQYSTLTKQIAKKENRRITDFQKSIDRFVSGEPKALASIISDFSVNTVTRQFKVFKAPIALETLSPQDFMNAFLSGGKEDVEEIEDNIISPSNISYTAYYKTFLKQYHINKNTYYTYVHTQSKQHINKVFFTNVAFFLSLDLKQAEKMYQSNGFSIQNSRRYDDEILSRCFECGVPQQYASVLLKSAGYANLDICKKGGD